MEREKTLILMLLDLCAFAYSQNKGERERMGLEAACRLAERYAMPEEKLYRDILARLEWDAAEDGFQCRERKSKPGLIIDQTPL